jgi:hypothetical protein
MDKPAITEGTGIIYEKSSREWICGDCSKVMKHPIAAKNHWMKNHGPRSAGALYTCGHCAAKFKLKRDLDTHWHATHGKGYDDATYGPAPTGRPLCPHGKTLSEDCDTCDVPSWDDDDADADDDGLLDTKSAWKWQCRVCSTRFVDKSDLDSHRCSHYDKPRKPRMPVLTRLERDLLEEALTAYAGELHADGHEEWATICRKLIERMVKNDGVAA